MSASHFLLSNCFQAIRLAPYGAPLFWTVSLLPQLFPNKRIRLIRLRTFGSTKEQMYEGN